VGDDAGYGDFADGCRCEFDHPAGLSNIIFTLTVVFPPAVDWHASRMEGAMANPG
jgi:hypothetical protein